MPHQWAPHTLASLPVFTRSLLYVRVLVVANVVTADDSIDPYFEVQRQSPVSLMCVLPRNVRRSACTVACANRYAAPSHLACRLLPVLSERSWNVPLFHSLTVARMLALGESSPIPPNVDNMHEIFRQVTNRGRQSATQRDVFRVSHFMSNGVSTMHRPDGEHDKITSRGAFSHSFFLHFSVCKYTEDPRILRAVDSGLRPPSWAVMLWRLQSACIEATGGIQRLELGERRYVQRRKYTVLRALRYLYGRPKKLAVVTFHFLGTAYCIGGTKRPKVTDVFVSGVCFVSHPNTRRSQPASS